MNKYILLLLGMLFTINLFAQVDKVKSKEYFHKADSLFDLQKLELGVKKQSCEDFYKSYNMDYKEVMQVVEGDRDLEKPIEENKSK